MPFKVRTPLPLYLLLAAAALALPPSARAQEASAAPNTRAAVAQKVDEYGRIGHCDMTARLDNFAIELQNDPGAKAFIIGYDPKAKGRGRASWGLKVGRYYLVNTRGIDASRIAAVEGGERDGDEPTTELWLVPEGAEPPVKLPAEDRYTARDYSGKFDTYTTDELVYREQFEMGYTGAEVSQSDFAEKLKQQPNSVGYLVVRTSKRSAPGVWRRVARREEQFIEKDYGIAAARLSSVYGGQAGGESAEVELWILPKSAPPPEGAKEQAAPAPREAVRLNRVTVYDEVEKDEDGWVLNNIAETLHENPRALACIVAREPQVFAAEGGEGAAEASADSKGEAAEPEVPAPSTKEVAERWKKTLTKKYGIYPWRVVVLEGRRAPWGGGRLNVWLVPEHARWPDPQAPDEDDPEEEQ